VDSRAGGKIFCHDHRSLADFALLAVQGPRAAEIVQSLTSTKLDVLKYYHFTEGTVRRRVC